VNGGSLKYGNGLSFHSSLKVESNINMLIPMHEQGEDGLGTPVKHLMCSIRKEDKRG